MENSPFGHVEFKVPMEHTRGDNLAGILKFEC